MTLSEHVENPNQQYSHPRLTYICPNKCQGGFANICMMELRIEGIMRAKQTSTGLLPKIVKMGKRSDLNNQYFRSRWEANYARFLNFLIEHPQGDSDDVIKWEYEPDTFEFRNIKRGTRFYTPDFKVYLKKGEFEYHEIKGWDYPKGRTARRRFNKYYPQYILKLIEVSFFKALKQQGYNELIPDWED